MSQWWTRGATLSGGGERRFVGSAGLDQLEDVFTLPALEPERFSLTLRRVQREHFAIEHVVVDAQLAARRLRHGRATSDGIITTLRIEQGALRMRGSAAPVELGPGRCAVIDHRDAPIAVTSSHVVAVQASIDVALLGRMAPYSVAGGVQQVDGELVTAFFDLATAVLERLDRLSERDVETAMDALLAHQLAVLECTRSAP